MPHLPAHAESLFRAVPFPEHDGGLFTHDGRYTRPWQTEDGIGDLTVRLDDTDQPEASVTADRIRLGSILAAAAETWLDTASIPTPYMPPDRPAIEWLPARLPLADGTGPEPVDYYGAPLVRLRFTPAPGARLHILLSPHSSDLTSRVLATLLSRDYDTVTQYMQALHTPF